MRGKNEKSFMPGLSRNVFFVGLVSLFMDVSSEMVYPLVPLFLTDVLGATKTAVGIIEGIAEATASILKIFSGWISDRLGRRKLVMSVGYGISVVSRPVIAGAGTWFEVLTARFIDRVGKGIRTAPRDAIIADSTEGGRLGLAFGFHRTMDTVGAVIGPALAVALLYMFSGDLRTVFLASAVPGVIAVAVIIIFIKEKRPPARSGVKPPRLAVPAFDGRFRAYLVVIGIFSLGNFSDAFLILQAQNLGVQKELIPVVYLLFNLVYAASSAPMGLVADRMGLRATVAAGFLFYSAVFAAVAFSSSSLHIWFLLPLYGVYKGMSEGNQRAYLAAIAPAEAKATAFGVYHTVVGLALLPASLMAGVLWDSLGAKATFLFGAVMGLAAAIVFAVFIRNSRARRAGEAG